LAAACARGRIVVTSPVYTDLDIAIADIPKLKNLVRAALRARAWFDKHGPAWAKPLPLSNDERESLFRSKCPYMYIAARYSWSLQGRDFDYLDHPQLFDYARGLMASEYTASYLRDDPQLQAEFPPKLLPGLTSSYRWCPLRNRLSRMLDCSLYEPSAAV
jgi:hypothetical protein